MTTLASPEHTPSARTLVLTTIAAIAVAGVVLVTTVLPAEYGIDPVGTGRMLGLTAIAEPAVDVGSAGETPAPASDALVPQTNGPVSHFAVPYRADSIDLVLDAYQYVEYKYRLEKGATMLYAWSANTAPVYDFHADPDGDPPLDPVSFDKESKTRASGAFTAPFSGIHGWFWENPTGEPLTIKLTTSGFYSAVTEFRSPRVRRSHVLTPLEALVFPARTAGAPAPPQ